MSKTSVALTTTGQFVLTTEAGTVVLTKEEAALLSGKLSTAQFEYKRLNTPVKPTPVFEVGDTVRSRTSKPGSVCIVRAVHGNEIGVREQNGLWHTYRSHMLELVKKAPVVHRRLFRVGDIVTSRSNYTGVRYTVTSNEVEGRMVGLKSNRHGSTYKHLGDLLELVTAAPEPVRYERGDVIIVSHPGLETKSYTVLYESEDGRVAVLNTDTGGRTVIPADRVELVKKAPAVHRLLFREGDIVSSLNNNTGVRYLVTADEVRGQRVSLEATRSKLSYTYPGELLELVEASTEPYRYEQGDVIFVMHPDLETKSYIVLYHGEDGRVQVRDSDTGHRTVIPAGRQKRLKKVHD